MKTISKKLLFLLLFLPLAMLAQSTVNGVVTDQSSGQPLPGVNVIVKGTTKGTTTDFDGKFTLSNVKSGEVIEFSFVGYKTSDVSYTNQKTMNVSLEEETAKLEEVVLIGYGTVKKKDATGSVTTVTAKDFNKGAVVSGSELLNGKIAGVTINTGGGAPGSIGQIRIRGGSSLNANNDPLVVIDGLPMSDTGVLNRLNPNDIESFSILKDASATAIYGTRASNGVILIATKKGAKKFEVEYNFQYGSGNNFNKVDVMNATQYREAFKNVLQLGLYPELTSAYLSGTTFDEDGISQFIGNANTDWQDEIYRRTDFVDNNLSVRGNLFNKIPTRLTIGNTYQEGLLLTDKLNRNTISFSTSPTLFDNHLKFNINVNYANTTRRNAPFVVGNALRMAPTRPVYNPNSPFEGFYEWMVNGSDETNIQNFAPISVPNPVAQLLQTFNTSKNEKFFGNIEVDYKFHFLPELRWVANLGYDKDWGYGRSVTGRFARTSPIFNNAFIGNESFNDGESINKLLDTYFVYSKSSDKLTFDLTAGYSYQKFEGNSFGTGNVRNPNNIIAPRFFNEPKVYIGYFGRSNINLLDKYLLTLTYRRDGTSRFSEDNRWGNFPAASFAWKIKNDFFKSSTKLSDLKLRLGWGVTGQQEIGFANSSLIYLPQYLIGLDNSSYIFGNEYILPALPQGYNPVIKWEETTTYNAGIDFGISDNRLTGSVDFYLKKSNDLLQIAPFADGSNFTNEGPQNFGSLTIKGVELNINYDVIRREKLNWNVNFNASKFERRIDEMPAGADQLTGNVGFGFSQINREGYTPNSFYVFKQVYDQNGRAIEGAFADLNGDGIINEADRYLYKNGDPDFTFGFTSNLNYNNFDLSFNLRASVGNRVYNALEARNSFYAEIMNGVPNNLHTNVNNTQFLTYTGNQAVSDMFIENASFLRMDYVNLGYTFQNWLEGKAKLRVFTGVQNPFIITKYGGLDPEIVGGIDQAIYPRQRQYLFGCNIKF